MPVAVPKIDYYAVLDVSHDATEDEIRAAYKKLALKWHPDRHQENKDEAQEKFVEIKDAYIHLLDDFEKKQRRKARKEKPASSAASDASSMRAPSSAPSECASEAPPMKPETERKEMRKHKEPRKEDKPSPPADSPSDPPKSHSGNSAKHHSTNSPSTPKPTRATLKKSPKQRPDRNEHGSFSHRRSEHDDSSDDEYTRPKKDTHPHKSSRNLDDSDYEFVDLADLGTPLHPLRGPKTKETKDPKSSDSHDKDWIFPLSLTLEELYRGSSQHFRVSRTLRSGQSQSVKIDVRASPSWTTGTRVRVPGVGNERRDGTFQDMVFLIEVLPHPRFTRSGDDLLLSVQVPWADSHPRPYSSSSDCTDDDNAGFPAEEEVYVKALDGEEYALPIPLSLVEAADGSRIVGAGMPVRKNGKKVGRGDLIVKWDFVFPDVERGQKLRWQSLRKAMHWKR